MVASDGAGETSWLPVGERLGDGGAHVGPGVDGKALAHFRSVAARLLREDEAPPHSLVLRGRVAQSSYPGGFYRYAIEVGAQTFMVDDPARIALGEPVAVCLPADAVHLYPDGESGVE